MLKIYQPAKKNQIIGEFDYEKQSFDHLGINPYEVVVAVSKKAREINDKAQKYLNSEYEIHPANLALKKLESEEIAFTYDDEQSKFSADAIEKD